MHRLRSNRLGSWCAIFALAIQLFASFGHVHRGGTMRPFALGFDYCAVCTVVALAGTVLPSAGPELPLLNMVGAVGHWGSADFASMPLRHFIFQARAPPR